MRGLLVTMLTLAQVIVAPSMSSAQLTPPALPDAGYGSSRPLPGHQELQNLASVGWHPVRKRPSRPYRWTQVTREPCLVDRREFVYEEVVHEPDNGGTVGWETVTVLARPGDPGVVFVTWWVNSAPRPATSQELSRTCAPVPEPRYGIRALLVEEQPLAVPRLGVAPPERGITGIETYL